MKPMQILILLVVMLLGASASAKEVIRNASWATPLNLEGVPNLHKISEDLYRSAQPNEVGMMNLE
ncbi:MAG TPA: hypothetical protein DCZ69_04985, partial [Syntrophobacteraceae bacterium]|nr:hypothetical protein [Syntrophobacteraceae bacterium]